MLRYDTNYNTGQYEKKRNRIVFEDAPFSYIRLKHSIISSHFVLAGIIPKVDTSFVRTLSSLYMIDPRINLHPNTQ